MVRGWGGGREINCGPWKAFATRPDAERAPLMAWMEERRREKDRRHLSQLIVELYGWSHLAARRVAMPDGPPPPHCSRHGGGGGGGGGAMRARRVYIRSFHRKFRDDVRCPKLYKQGKCRVGVGLAHARPNHEVRGGVHDRARVQASGKQQRAIY